MKDYDCEDCIGMIEHGCYCKAVGAVAPGGPAASEARIMPCERCGSEGRLYSGRANDPNPHDDGPCPVCEGTGGEIIETEPVTLDDLCCSDGVALPAADGAKP